MSKLSIILFSKLVFSETTLIQKGREGGKERGRKNGRKKGKKVKISVGERLLFGNYTFVPKAKR